MQANEDLIEQFEQVDREFEQNSSEGPIEAANSANGDHIKLWASDQEDRFLSEEEDEQMGDINEDSEDGEYSSEGEPDSEMNNSNFSSDEEGQILEESMAELHNSGQSYMVLLNPSSKNNLSEEDLDYLKGMPAFQTYVQKLVSKEISKSQPTQSDGK